MSGRAGESGGSRPRTVPVSPARLPAGSAAGVLVGDELWAVMRRVGAAGWSPEAGEEYHGPHVPARRRGCEPIEWRPVPGPVDRARVLSHTCECQTVVYELCGLGGSYFLRRTTWGPGLRVRVAESPRIIAGRCGVLWVKLLQGLAR